MIVPTASRSDPRSSNIVPIATVFAIADVGETTSPEVASRLVDEILDRSPG